MKKSTKSDKKLLKDSEIQLLCLTFNQNELSEALDEKDLRVFKELVKSAIQHDYDLNSQYGPEVGYKTILHLALEEEDGLPYVEELLKVSTIGNFHENNHATSQKILSLLIRN